MEGELVNPACWQIMPDPMLMQVFRYLTARELLDAGQTCNHWHRVSQDEMLWKWLFHRDFNIDPRIGILPGSTSWQDEYKRLMYHIPIFCTEELKNHSDEVLHVSFAHNGTMFATSSKDSHIIVWNSDYPVSEKYWYDMINFNWKYTQFSQFNQSDTVLLVSGVLEDAMDGISGEIAVFSLTDGFALTNRIPNCPYDIFGTWCSDHHFLSGDLLRFSSLITSSELYLNCASSSSLPLPVSEETSMRRQFRFSNTGGSYIRRVMLANRVNTNVPEADMSTPSQCHKHVDDAGTHRHSLERDASSSSIRPHTGGQSSDQYKDPDKDGCSDEVKVESRMSAMSMECDNDNKVVLEKYLIFTKGLTSYTPHQIGLKKVKQHVSMAKGKDLNGAEFEYHKLTWESNSDSSDVDTYDTFDHVIDLHGHIVGMALSPDHRFLYVNCRSWPVGYHTDNPLDPPPIAEEIDMHVIDLVTLQDVSTLRGHKAYTPGDDCFFLFMDVCDHYVASGAEDKHGYLWDRHYGVCLAKYPHTDVVNSVAFNPQNSDMLVTTSDDFRIRVWRSRTQLDSLLGAAEIKDLTRAITNWY